MSFRVNSEYMDVDITRKHEFMKRRDGATLGCEGCFGRAHGGVDGMEETIPVSNSRRKGRERP